MKNNPTESDRFIQALESDKTDALSFEDQQVHQFGQDLKTIGESELPESDEALRETLALKLAEQELVLEQSEKRPLKPKKAESRLGWRLALAGCIVLAASLAVMMMPFGQTEQVAQIVPGIEPSTNEAVTSWREPVEKYEEETEELDTMSRSSSIARENAPTQSGQQQASQRQAVVVDGRRSESAVQLFGTDVADQKSDDLSDDVVLQVDSKSAPIVPNRVDKTRMFKKVNGDGDMEELSDQAQSVSNQALMPKPADQSKVESYSLVIDESLSREAKVARFAAPAYGVPPVGGSNPSAAPAKNLRGAVLALSSNGPNVNVNGLDPSAADYFGDGGIGGIGGGGGLGGGGGGRGGRKDYGRYRARIPEQKEAAGENLGLHFDFQERTRRRGYYEALSQEQYEPITENEFYQVDKTNGGRPLSTFSIDVDTASYSNMRRFLQSGQRPPRNAIRIEELVNYFDYDYPQPQDERPFAVDMEIANCPWNEQHHLLRVALKGKEIHRSERAATNLVFLLDVSGSMQDQNKLPLLKQGLMMMVQQLTENDSVSIVTYAGNAGVVLNPTNGDNKRQIEKAIEKLNAGGSTNGSAGIELAYEMAQKQFINGGSNRVILATDGDLNVGITDDNALVELIKRKASEGVFLTVLGFGTGNLKDGKLEKLADNGNGMYAYIDSFREAHKVLIEQMSGSLETIAKDVKIQIEFNPREVSSYRLIGYENRVLAAKDFDNDKKDAGEIGAGHSVTALYELVLAGGAEDSVVNQNLKYQQNEKVEEPKAQGSNDNDPGELLTLALRYKKPDAQESEKIEFVLKDEPTSFSSASSEFRFAAAVASFGMILRGSQHQGETSYRWVETTASRAVGEDRGGYRAEFIDLVRQASNVR